MRHLKKGRKFSRTSAHRDAMFSNLATSLFQHECIETTREKAKDLRGFAERLITLAKRNDLHARRLAFRHVRNLDVLKKLFDDIAPRFQSRAGGYTRVMKSGVRKGDAAPLSVIELVERKNPPVAEKAA
jgi:large subunit ribosomal protein L17